MTYKCDLQCPVLMKHPDRIRDKRDFSMRESRAMLFATLRIPLLQMFWKASSSDCPIILAQKLNNHRILTFNCIDSELYHMCTCTSMKLGETGHGACSLVTFLQKRWTHKQCTKSGSMSRELEFYRSSLIWTVVTLFLAWLCLVS